MIFYIILPFTLMSFNNNWVAPMKPILGVIYPNGGTAFQWAVMLTNPAADAKIAKNTWSLYRAGLPAGISHLSFFQTDGFLRCGAHLLAHNARNTTGPWQTAVVVDAGFPNHCQAFFFQFEQRNGTRRAYLAASCTAIITITHAWHYQWGP